MAFVCSQMWEEIESPEPLGLACLLLIKVAWSLTLKDLYLKQMELYNILCGKLRLKGAHFKT